MSSPNYLWCNHHRVYIPIWHPATLSFWMEHAACSNGNNEQKFDFLASGTKVPIVGCKPEPSVGEGDSFPESYNCAVDLSPIEELAYSTKPDHAKLS